MFMYIPTPVEQERFYKSINPRLASLWAQVATGFKRLDFRLIGAVLDDECTFDSQTMDAPLWGKLAIASYFTGQFKDKRSGEGFGRPWCAPVFRPS